MPLDTHCLIEPRHIVHGTAAMKIVDALYRPHDLSLTAQTQLDFVHVPPFGDCRQLMRIAGRFTGAQHAYADAVQLVLRVIDPVGEIGTDLEVCQRLGDIHAIGKRIPVVPGRPPLPQSIQRDIDVTNQLNLFMHRS